MEELSNHQNENSSYKSGKEGGKQNQQPFLNRTNSMDEWLFGTRRMNPAQQEPVSPQQNQIDFKQVMETIDMAYITWNQYKPIFNDHLTPMVDNVKSKLSFKK